MNKIRVVLTLALVATTIIGCSGSQTHQVIGPDGKQAVSIDCKKSMSGCYEEASTYCTHGYDVLQTSGNTSIAGYGGGIGSMYHGQLLIECKAEHVETAISFGEPITEELYQIRYNKAFAVCVKSAINDKSIDADIFCSCTMLQVISNMRQEADQYHLKFSSQFRDHISEISLSHDQTETCKMKAALHRLVIQ